MSKWIKTIDLTDLQGPSTDPEYLRHAGNEIVRRMQPEGAPLRWLLKGLTYIDTDVEVASLLLERGVDDVREWADEVGIWLGGPRTTAEAFIEMLKEAKAPEELIAKAEKALENAKASEKGKMN
jgi:hypothetical protein